jgi:hypothetical protein
MLHVRDRLARCVSGDAACPPPPARAYGNQASSSVASLKKMAPSIHCADDWSRSRWVEGGDAPVQAYGPGRAQPERNIRVALFGLTQFDDGIVTTLIRDTPGIDVVSRLAPGSDLRDAFEASGADVLVCALSTKEMIQAWEASLARHPPLAVFNLADDRGWGRLYALRTATHTIERLDGPSLLDALVHVQRAGWLECRGPRPT